MPLVWQIMFLCHRWRKLGVLYSKLWLYNSISKVMRETMTWPLKKGELNIYYTAVQQSISYFSRWQRAEQTTHLWSEALPTQLIFKQIRQKCCRNSANLFRDYYKHASLVGSVQLSYVDRDYIHIVFNIRLTATKLTYIYYK